MGSCIWNQAITVLRSLLKLHLHLSKFWHEKQMPMKWLFCVLSFPRWLIKMAEGFGYKLSAEVSACNLFVMWNRPRSISLVEVIMLLALLLFEHLAHAIKSVAKFCITYLGQNQNCRFCLYSMMYLSFQEQTALILKLWWSGTRFIWHIQVVVFQSLTSEGFCWLLWETFCSFPLGLYPFHCGVLGMLWCMSGTSCASNVVKT